MIPRSSSHRVVSLHSRALSLVPVLVVFAALSFLPPRSHAAQGEASEARVKAAFLFKFTSYVNWPPAAQHPADAPLVIGVVEADELADELTRQAAGKLVSNRPVQVRRLTASDAVGGCHVLFIGSAARERLAKVLAATHGLPILTVTEADEALSLGSVINFVIVNDQVRFDIALSAAERNNLRISSRLLTVARRVVAGGP